MRTGPTNPQLKSLIAELKSRSYKEKGKIWGRLAEDLEKPSRQRRTVNLSRINRFAKDGETIVVPGKVLAAGELDRGITIAAWQFSDSAKEKIEKANGKAMLLSDLLNAQSISRTRIIG